ncbi:hypothetical protein [Mammaliicoccus vitulinus]|uniref:hypothetical protein n=1 Tax=Mammaliicoccus vitulinus TaxID=71237 RepID=UPI00248CE527|nr:hypothetical protein [Mammaliicoccus vitulinus]
MPFINNIRLKEIREAATSGNEKAQVILQQLRKRVPQDDINRLVEDYYKITQDNIMQEPVELPPTDEELAVMKEENPVNTPQVDVVDVDEALQDTSNVDTKSIDDILNKELDGLLDETELEDLRFNDFLGNKKKNSIRQLKNNNYFKAYDPVEREEYLNKRIDNYKNKFNDKLSDIARNYNDINLSLDQYLLGVNDMLDDDNALDVIKANKVYDAFTDNVGLMHSFGRYWDESDKMKVLESLKALKDEYGKQNVIAALNTLKSDNDNYRDYCINQINAKIDRFSKSIANLLK